jgi:Ni/Co efflux regulator RcnB
MKKILSAVMAAAVVLATVALARPAPEVSDAQVQAAIDARLHELLVSLNNRHHR